MCGVRTKQREITWQRKEKILGFKQQMKTAHLEMEADYVQPQWHGPTKVRENSHTINGEGTSPKLHTNVKGKNQDRKESCRMSLA